jgi:hypothetical protein
MPMNISPKKVQEAVLKGRERFRNFRKARLLFLRNYVGQYYDKQNGEVGTEALNLIFNAIRVLVPYIVMNFPTFTVRSKYLMGRNYGELLSLALNQHSQTIDVKSVYRRWIVDAIFTLGILKTGLAQSDSIYGLDDGDHIDAGTVYTEAVDFDNFVVDPSSRDHMFRDARWMGDSMYVPRSLLLDSGLYKNDLIEKLPGVSDAEQRERAHSLSMRGMNAEDVWDLEDEVEIAELWVPGAKAIVTVPVSENVVFDDYLRTDDFYGLNDGPYTLLALTPPVPGNPLPVPAVGIWNDLHTLANKMAKKIVDQALRQKDIVAYRSQAADDAQEMLDAKDGETVRCDDPDGVQVRSFGGQQNSNEMALVQMQGWFNMMAANPETMGGQGMQASSATQSRILAGNASIGLEDVKDLVYQAVAAEGRRRAWYFHTDPLIQMPLIRRLPEPAQYAPGTMGPIMVAPARMREVQVFLTPEARRGDFLDFVFVVEPESMGRVDSKTRFAQALDFAAKILPTAAAAAQTMAMLGVSFSVKEYIIRMAKDSGIDWLDQVFYDPEFQMQMAQRLAAGPPADSSKGTPQSGGMMDQILQNGQPAGVMGGAPDPMTQIMQDEQAGANLGQREVKQEML